ncbi:MAG: nucleotidyltransferase family protein [Actinomycetota bacterium]
MREAGPVDTNGLRVAAVVLAAGSSRRLGQPKQLLPFRGATLLDATLDRVRSFSFAQTIVALGGAAPEVRTTVDLVGCTVVDSVHHTEGCSSSIVASLAAIADDVDGFLLFLGDQPDVAASTVDRLLAVAGHSEIAVVDYTDGSGHPFWFARSMFGPLGELHGDKAVWKLLESGRFETAAATVDASVPLDVDTWEDYERLLATEPA